MIVVESARRRRHGSELEAALLTAAWDEIIEVGYGRLTMESIALRAHTSEAVLYRRWANKDALVHAALQHYRSTHPVVVPDTGSLRTDLIATLTAVAEARAGFFAIAAAAAFSGLMSERGLTPATARARMMGDQAPPLIREIYQWAHDRGEIDLDRLPVAVLTMPFDLLRHDLFMDLKPPSAARIESIVDDLFLPLVEIHRQQP